MKTRGAMKWLALVAGVVLLGRAADGPALDPADQGKQLTQRAAGVLSSNLLAALTRGGTTNAIQFCSTRALPLTVAAGTNGILVRRVSHRPRNPVNRASSNDLAVIQQFQAKLRPGAGLTPVLTTNSQGQVTFYAPIVLNTPLCLQCHGTPEKEVAAQTGEVLHRLYPQDEALNFKLGELRGAWRVDFPAPRP